MRAMIVSACETVSGKVGPFPNSPPVKSRKSHPPYIVYVTNHEECALLRDWNASLVPVYFDLGVRQEDGQMGLWRRDSISQNGRVYLTPASPESFLKVHHEGLDAEARLSEGIGVIVENLQQAANRRPPPWNFRQHTARRTRF
jgi:competence protein CoiA